MHRFLSWIVVLIVIFLAGPVARAAPPSREGLEFFEKKIRPLLAENCHMCHGPEKQKAKLRLDSQAAFLKGGESGPPVVAGEPGKSLLLKAVSYTDPERKMPPRGKLADQHIADLTAWVKMGAPWPDEALVKKGGGKEFNLKERSRHWSLLPLKNVPLPAVLNQDWPKSPIDNFILTALEDKGLKPAPPADKPTLLRRVTFDLIGLPPTAKEIDDFLKDESPEALRKVVERLLESPHYGERWARHWLDLVRFAETYGHEFDFEIPQAWRYRDYVIRAFNSDVPYDQFVREHLAGDLLKEPRRHPTERFNESILGTGFFWLGEAKHSPVDVRGDQADRIDNQIDVFGKTFLGMTLACARCHDHKFDAISTKDYYALAGYLQSSRMQLAFLDGPELWKEKLRDLREVRQELQQRATDHAVAVVAGQFDTLAKQLPFARPEGPKGRWHLLGDAKSKLPFPAKRQAAVQKLQARGAAERAAKGAVFADFRQHDVKDWFLTGEAFGQVPSRGTEVLVQENRPILVQQIAPPGLAHSGLVSGKLQGALRSPTFTITKKKIHLHGGGQGTRINLILDGLQLIRDPIYGGLTMNLNNESLQWRTFNVGMWLGHRAYLEVLDDGPGYAAVDRIVFSDDGPPPEGPNSLLLGLLQNSSLKTEEALVKNYRHLFEELLGQWRAGKLVSQADAADRIELVNWMLQAAQPTSPPAPEEAARLAILFKKHRGQEAALPSPQRGLALADGSAVNEKVFIRGNHKNLGDVVPRRFLEVFGSAAETPPEKGSGRLELAQRLVDPFKTPIVPRVLVNRLWKHHFGEGIVRSVDDFGVLGQPPTHPELLDYLAVQLIKQGWSIKEMHRMMVLSSTYQMASKADPKTDELDPENRLLHKMPVRRLEAEAIRDAMLAVSGRLDRTLYGPGVLPHLTPFMVGRGRPGTSGPLDGASRRSVYLNVRRNFLNPMFLAFDYPTPFSTMGRRSVSNVPAQALTLMNNPFVLQQADLWAKNVLAEPKFADSEGIRRMYVTALARLPSETELREMLGFLADQGRAYGKAGDPRAWRDLAHVLFNVKEFIYVN